MIDAAIRPETRAVRVAWPDGVSADFAFVWLRDNCASAFHPETRERTVEMRALPRDLAARNVIVDPSGALVVTWSPDDHVSRYDLDWLRAHRPGAAAPDPARIAPRLWDETFIADGAPRIDATALLSDDAALLSWLRALRADGLSIVQNLEASPEAGVALAQRVGFLRETNFGVKFEVMSKPNPNNIAYTAEALPLHTDLPNQELAPGFQFLHCIANDAIGGGSVFVDGFAAAERLRAEDPGAFELLALHEIPFRFHDATHDLRRHATVIETDPQGGLREIRHSTHLADSFDLPSALVGRYYAAYHAFLDRLAQPDAQLTLRLGAREMAVFDNRRILHGRERYDPNTGLRHLRGYYVDHGELDSRIRVLSRG